MSFVAHFPPHAGQSDRARPEQYECVFCSCKPVALTLAERATVFYGTAPTPAALAMPARCSSITGEHFLVRAKRPCDNPALIPDCWLPEHLRGDA